jgi:hypothetical protein
MAKIIVILPDNRDLNGSLRIIDDNGRTIKGPFVVKGRAADNVANDPKNQNPTRDRLRNYGDTPLGTYKAGPKILPTGKGTRRASLRSYGPNGAIWLIPSGGEALQAANTFTRDRLLIHGGDLYENTPIGKANHYVGLRPTGGCLRVSNDDMRQIVDAVMLLQAFGDPVGECSVQKGIEVSVTEVPSPQNVEPDELKVIRDPPDTSSAFGGLANPYLPSPSPPPRHPGPPASWPPPRTPHSEVGTPRTTPPPNNNNERDRIKPGQPPDRAAHRQPGAGGGGDREAHPQPGGGGGGGGGGVRVTPTTLGFMPTSTPAITSEDYGAGRKKAAVRRVEVKRRI